MKILITGGNGFIGKNLKEKFTGRYNIECPGREELDLLNEEAVEEYLRSRRFDIVIHAANRNNTRNKGTTPYDSLDGNLRMFFNLEKCNNYYRRMYYFGSGAEFHNEYYIPDMTEEYFGSHVPEDPYAFSKYIMSKHSAQNNNIYNLRLFGVYGKYEEWERRFISNAICRTLAGKDIRMRQNVYFDYLWVEDLADIMEWFVLNRPVHKHYNVCRGTKIDLYSLACMIRDILAVDCDIQVESPGWKKEYTGCNNRLLSEIGGYEFTSFKESVQSLCDFYRSNMDSVDVNLLK